MGMLKKLAKTKDFFAAICLYILSFYIYSVARSYPVIPGAPRAQNAGFYPKLIAVVLIILSTIYLFQIVLKIKRETEATEEKENEGFWANSTKETKAYLLITLLMLGAYLLVLRWFGFATAMFMFFLVVSRMLSPKDKKLSKIIIVSLLVTALLYLVFDIFVGIRFPEGILF